MSKTGKSIETESSNCDGLGVRKRWEVWEVTAKGHGFSFGGNINVLKFTVVMVAQPYEYTKKH